MAYTHFELALICAAREMTGKPVLEAEEKQSLWPKLAVSPEVFRSLPSCDYLKDMQFIAKEALRQRNLADEIYCIIAERHSSFAAQQAMALKGRFDSRYAESYHKDYQFRDLRKLFTKAKKDLLQHDYLEDSYMTPAEKDVLGVTLGQLLPG